MSTSEVTDGVTRVFAEYDEQAFLATPTQDDLGREWDTVADWSHEAAAAVTGDPDVTSPLNTWLAEHFQLILGIEHDDGPSTWTYLHIPDPTVSVLPVYVYRWEASDIAIEDSEAEVRCAALADDPTAVEPPLVERVESPGLGAGLRVIRYLVDVEGGNDLWATVRYVWHVPAAEVMIEVRSLPVPPSRLIAAMDDIDDLARSIRWAPETAGV